MRIGVICTSGLTAFGGSEELIVELAKTAVGRGHDFSVSVFDWGHLHPKWQALSELGVHIKSRKRIQYSNLTSKICAKLFYNKYSFWQLKRFTRRSFDILIVNLGGFRNLETTSYLNLLENYKGKFIIISHVSSEAYHCPFSLKKRIRDVCYKSFRIFFVSKRLRILDERNIGFLFANSDIIVNPVNISAEGILPFADMEMLHMACVGRLNTTIKGQALLLQVLGQDCWKERKWILNIYGKGEDEEYLRYLADFYGISQRVVFKGHAEDVRNEIWKINHVLLLPSYQEGLPLALIEAMLCGRSAVVTDVGGNAEVLEENHSGFIAEAATFGSFSAAMNKMWENRSNLEFLGQNAFASAKSYIESGINATVLLKMLENSFK